MHKVGNEVHVALRAPTSTLSTKRLLVGEAEEKEPQVVGEGAEGRVIESRAVLEVRVVPVGDRCEGRKGNKMEVSTYTDIIKMWHENISIIPPCQ